MGLSLGSKAAGQAREVLVSSEFVFSLVKQALLLPCGFERVNLRMADKPSLGGPYLLPVMTFPTPECESSVFLSLMPFIQVL